MLTEDQRQIREMAHAFAERELAPTAAERDRTPRFPREAFAKMAELGLLGMTVPEEFDGAGAEGTSDIQRLVISRELAKQPRFEGVT